MSDFNVVEFKRESWRDIVKTLRKIADDIENEVMTKPNVAMLVTMSKDHEIQLYGLGEDADPLSLVGLHRISEQVIVDQFVYPEEES